MMGNKYEKLIPYKQFHYANKSYDNIGEKCLQVVSFYNNFKWRMIKEFTDLLLPLGMAVVLGTDFVVL